MDNIQAKIIQSTSRLYDAKSVTIATFIGSPLAGAIILAINYYKLKQPGYAWLLGGIGAIFALAEIFFSSLFPKSMYLFGLGILQAFIGGYIAAKLQGRILEQHVRNGNFLASRWSAAGIGFLCMLAIMALVLAWSIFSNPNMRAAADLIKGDCCLRQGKYDEAISEFNKVIEHSPQFAKAYIKRVTAYEFLKQDKKALNDFSLAIYLASNNPQAYNDRAAVYYKLGQYQRAIDDWTRTLTLDPKFVDADHHRQQAIEELHNRRE